MLLLDTGAAAAAAAAADEAGLVDATAEVAAAFATGPFWPAFAIKSLLLDDLLAVAFGGVATGGFFFAVANEVPSVEFRCWRGDRERAERGLMDRID